MSSTPSRMKSAIALLFALLAPVLLSACTPVAAWERGTLARDEMALNADPLEQSLDNHIYFSKEASSGSNSASGGGCGCN
jgi:hypothetical protein